MKSKVKKIVAIVLASTMLMGMSLTASAAPRKDYTIGATTTICKFCTYNSAVLREVSFSQQGVKFSWQCGHCNMWFTTNN